MSAPFRTVLVSAFALAAVLGLAASAAFAAGITPGLWRIVSRTQTGGVIGPPHESSRCLTTDEAQDVAATFAPPTRVENSSCTPIEHSLNGQKLTWRITCRGQLNMEETGEFNFDSPRHYTATMQTRAVVSGTTMIDSQDMLEGHWISECK
jgi:hypothetical protein